MNLSNVKKILIINLGGIADLIYAVSVLKSVKREYPDIGMDILVVERCRELAESYHIFNNVYVCPINRFSEIIKVLLNLRKNRYDLVANMRTIVGLLGSLKMFFVIKLINGRKSVGRNTDGKGFFFNIKIHESYIAEKKEYEYDIDLVKALGVKTVKPVFNLPFTEKDEAYVEDILTSAGVKQNDFKIGVNPGGEVFRRWPAAYFAELIRQIGAELKCKVILIGSLAEKGLCDNISRAANYDGVINFAGNTTIPQSYLIASKMNLVISNDTSTMHMSGIAGIPGVFIFGGGQPIRHAPANDSGKYIVLQKPLNCSPCEKENCKSMRCLWGIGVGEVFEAVKKLKSGFYA